MQDYQIIWILMFLAILYMVWFYFSYWLPFWDDVKSWFKTGGSRPIEKWHQQDYETLKGEVVKSYGEKAIADFFYKRGINYEYEHPKEIHTGLFRTRLIHPDFYLPDYDVYLEYFGMMEYSKQYRYEMHLKFDTFKREHMKVIKIYKKHITNRTLKAGIEHSFRELTGKPLPNISRVPAIQYKVEEVKNPRFENQLKLVH